VSGVPSVSVSPTVMRLAADTMLLAFAAGRSEPHD